MTTAVAIVLTVAFDLTRIAALGAFAYLSLDMVIHWGHFRHLRDETGARPTPLLVAVGLDAVVLVGLLRLPGDNDSLVVAAFAVFAVLVAGGEYPLHAPLQRRRPCVTGRPVPPPNRRQIRSAHVGAARGAGFEPTTSGFKVRCSAS